MSKILDFVLDKNNPYSVKSELQVRKILEANTDYRLEFTKNEDPIGYDLKVNFLQLLNNDWRKQFKGYIEVEVSTSWKEGATYPMRWNSYSFLTKKVLLFDRFNNKFTPYPKYSWDIEKRTIYLIFSKDLKGCYAANLGAVRNFANTVFEEKYKDNVVAGTFSRVPRNQGVVCFQLPEVVGLVQKMFIEDQ